MPKLRAVFWDVDGTLADTEMTGHRESFNQAFSAFKLRWSWDKATYERLLDVHGGENRIRAYSDEIGSDLDPEFISRLHAKKQENYVNLIMTGNIELRIGVKRLLNEFRINGIKQWIVTTSSRKAVLPLIESKFDFVHKFFSGVVTSEDVQKQKPYPDSYEKAVRDAGVIPSEVLVIEDSLNGYLAAKAAGLSSLITLSPWISEMSEPFSSALAVVNHLGESTNSCKVFIGPPCSEGKVTLKYVKSLIHEAPK